MPLAYNSLKIQARSLKTGELDPSDEAAADTIVGSGEAVISEKGKAADVASSDLLADPKTKARQVVRKVSRPGDLPPMKRKAAAVSDAMAPSSGDQRKKMKESDSESTHLPPSGVAGAIPSSQALESGVSSSGGTAAVPAPKSTTAAVPPLGSIAVAVLPSQSAVFASIHSEPQALAETGFSIAELVGGGWFYPFC